MATETDFKIDRELGEQKQENEDELALLIANHIAEDIASRFKKEKEEAKKKEEEAKKEKEDKKEEEIVARRDAHPKPNGCVRAVFQVENELPPDLAQGVFVPGKSYTALIRFSNGNEDHTRHDAKGDARGMAIKLLDVPGEKILPEERHEQTQDFVMINHPVFFIDDAARYLELLRAKHAFRDDKESFLELIEGKGDVDLEAMLEKDRSDVGTILKGGAALSARGAYNFFWMTRSKIASPLETTYWSMVPYRLGDPPRKNKVKFRATPNPPIDSSTDFIQRIENQVEQLLNHLKEKDFLREKLIEQLKTGARRFDFEVQVGNPGMSVENSMVEWAEAEADFKKVATISIPEQDVKKYDKLENMVSFTPWHALPQHRPLGAVNRIRRVVYEKVSKKRHELNKEERRELTVSDLQ